MGYTTNASHGFASYDDSVAACKFDLEEHERGGRADEGPRGSETRDGCGA